jgi:hypothetical protein
MKHQLYLVLVFFTLSCNIILAQQDSGSRIKFELRAHDLYYDVKPGIFEIGPSFILGIRNNGIGTISLDRRINFGHAHDETHTDITYELLYVSGKDTVNVLDKIISQTPPKLRSEKINIYSNQAYFFEFNLLNSQHFIKSGKYLIRFKLLKKYLPKYMTEDILTEWVSFTVKLPTSK